MLFEWKIVRMFYYNVISQQFRASKKITKINWKSRRVSVADGRTTKYVWFAEFPQSVVLVTRKFRIVTLITSRLPNECTSKYPTHVQYRTSVTPLQVTNSTRIGVRWSAVRWNDGGSFSGVRDFRFEIRWQTARVEQKKKKKNVTRACMRRESCNTRIYCIIWYITPCSVHYTTRGTKEVAYKGICTHTHTYMHTYIRIKYTCIMYVVNGVFIVSGR